MICCDRLFISLCFHVTVLVYVELPITPITLLTLISALPPRRSEASYAGEELGERQVPLW